MPSPLRKDKDKWTYKDYLAWPAEERWEIIDGAAYAMSPAPSVKHQNIVSNLHIRLKTDKNNQCYTGLAPTDVVFDENNVVQPDVFIVCDRSKITAANIQGPPDLIIEVLSATTNLRDRREKKELYERFGVREYIMIEAEAEIAERYRLVERRYEGPDIFGGNETLILAAFPEISIGLGEIFEIEPPSGEEGSIRSHK